MASGFSISPFKPVDERYDTAPPHPGEILREDVLPHYGLSRETAARRMGVTLAELDEVLIERERLTADFANRLEAAFEFTAAYWLAIQRQYDLWHNALGEPGDEDGQGGEHWTTFLL